MMHQSHSRTAADIGGKLLMTLTLGLLLNAAFRWTRVTHERRTGSRPEKLPRKLQRWEGEGGRPSDSDDQEPELHPEPLPQSPGSPSLQR